LIWSGGDAIAGVAQYLRPCSRLHDARDHLCWMEKSSELSHVHRIMDASYKPIPEPYSVAGALRQSNLCGTKDIGRGKTFLSCVQERKKVDLTPYAGLKDGYIVDGCFEEINTATKEVSFRWCAAEHLVLWHTYVFLDIPENVVNHTGEAHGKGTHDEPWNCFHIVRPLILI
jgi:hypothetical protein